MGPPPGAEPDEGVMTALRKGVRSLTMLLQINGDLLATVLTILLSLFVAGWTASMLLTAF